MLNQLIRALRRCPFPPRSGVPKMWVRHSSEGQEFQSTTITMLSKEDSENIYIEAYSPLGLRLSTGMRIIGPCVLFPRSILHWNVSSAADINENSLSLFTMLEPKLDILVLGIGAKGTKYNPGIIKYLRQHKINVEILPTDQACSTFNFLNSEHRYVAGGFIPPSYMESEFDEDMFVQAQLQRRELDSMDIGFFDDKNPKAPGFYDDELKFFKEKAGLLKSADEDAEKNKKAGDYKAVTDKKKPDDKK